MHTHCCSGWMVRLRELLGGNNSRTVRGRRPPGLVLLLPAACTVLGVGGVASGRRRHRLPLPGRERERSGRTSSSSDLRSMQLQFAFASGPDTRTATAPASPSPPLARYSPAGPWRLLLAAAVRATPACLHVCNARPVPPLLSLAQLNRRVFN